MVKRILLFIIFMGAGFYGYYRYKMPHPHDFNWLKEAYPKEIINRLGGRLAMPKSRKQHFRNFPLEKKSGTIRIATLGDSNTYGAEVDAEGTYPYHLQQLLNRHFATSSTKVEVLNFGVSGHGFQEQFFLWEHFVHKYQIDYILLGPYGFWPDRDVGFILPYETNLQCPPKERYILSENGRVNLVAIEGENLKRRWSNFYSLFPSRVALNYDRHPFPTVEHFFPLLRGKLSNPFYYSSLSEDEESATINKILLQKMQEKHLKKILFLTKRYKIFKGYKNIQYPFNLNLINIPNLIFKFRFNHASSTHNEAIANIYFNALIGNKEFFVNLLHCSFRNNKEKKAEKRVDLNKVRDIVLVDGKGTLIGELRKNEHNHYYDNGSYASGKENWIHSFINIASSYDRALLQLPLGVKLRPKTPLYLLTDKVKIQLGPIEALDGEGIFFFFHRKYFSIEDSFSLFKDSGYYQEIKNSRNRVYLYLNQLPSGIKKQIGNSRSMELMVGKTVIGTFKRLGNGASFALLPNRGYQSSFLFMGGDKGSISDFPSGLFPLFVQYGQIRSPARIGCHKQKHMVKLNLTNWQPLPKP